MNAVPLQGNLSVQRYQAFADEPADPAPARTRSMVKALIVFSAIIGCGIALTVGLSMLKTVAFWGAGTGLLYLLARAISSGSRNESNSSWRWSSVPLTGAAYSSSTVHHSDRPAGGGRGGASGYAAVGRGRETAPSNIGRGASGGYAPVGQPRNPPAGGGRGGSGGSGFAPVGRPR